MKKVNIIEEFNTSLGKTFTIENTIPLRVGDEVDINGAVYRIKRVILPTTPTGKDIISIVV